MSCMRGTAEQGLKILRALRGNHHSAINIIYEIKYKNAADPIRICSVFIF